MKNVNCAYLPTMQISDPFTSITLSKKQKKANFLYRLINNSLR